MIGCMCKKNYTIGAIVLKLMIFCKTSLLIRSNSIQVMDINMAFFDCIDIND